MRTTGAPIKGPGRKKLTVLLRPGATKGEIAFEEALIFALNQAARKGEIAPGALEPAAELLRGSYRAWAANAAPGSSWGDVLFPNVLRLPSGSIRLPTPAIFVTLPAATLLLADTGQVIRQSPAEKQGERTIGGFLSQPSVIIEVLIDLINILLAAFGFACNAQKLEQYVDRLIMTNPAIRDLVKKIIQGLVGGGVGADDYVSWLAELARALFGAGQFGEFLKDAIAGFTFWDALALLLGFAALLIPGSAALKLAYILAQIAAAAVHLHDKYVKYMRGSN